MKSEDKTINLPCSFWYWFIWDETKDRSHPGYRRYFDGFMKWQVLFSLAISYGLHQFDVSLDMLSQGALTIVAIMFGTSFAWGGNAIGLLQSEELLDLMDQNKNGVADYVYTNQAAILLSLIATLAWGCIYTFKLPEIISSYIYFELAYIGASITVILLTFLTIRDCWHVISQVHWQIICKAVIRRKNQMENKLISKEE